MTEYLADIYSCPICESDQLELFNRHTTAQCATCTANYVVYPNRDIDYPYKLEFTGFEEAHSAAERMRDLANAAFTLNS